ncbi:MAG: FliM/FliN family flagellar motor switch protein [Planctomycetaceae bacterium]|nr:FliM/FliN family flagellar motor switch protein [Planctomycetaceae bacterium]
MSLDTENQKPTESADDPVDSSAAGSDPADTEQSDNDATDSDSSPDISVPEYQEFTDTSGSSRAEDLARLQNIQITVSAELGRATIPIQELMQLGEGTVLELNREIDSPVELMAQGVKLASGEVVVVDGCFAIRITEVEAQN